MHQMFILIKLLFAEDFLFSVKMPHELERRFIELKTDSDGLLRADQEH